MPLAEIRLVSYAELAVAWQLSPRTIQRWVYEDERRGIRVPRMRRRRGHAYVVLMRLEIADQLLTRHMPNLYDR